MSLVGLIHSTRLVIDPVHQAVTSQCAPGTEFFHVMDEGILRYLTAAGKITDKTIHWLTDMARSVENTGADMAVVTCSSLSPCVDDVRKRIGIPLLKIDEPMMEYAVNNAERVGLVMNNPTTEKPSRLLFNAVQQKSGKKTALISRLCPDAFNKLNRGDVAGHDAEIIQNITDLLQEVDLVLLAQISILRVRAKLDAALRRKVFSSLDFIALKINEILTGRH